MIFFRLTALAILAIVTPLLSSCIDGREEVWVNADGSGRADLRYEVPATAARLRGGEEGVRQLIADLLKDTPTATHEVVQEGDRLKIRVKMDFQSPGDLKSITSSSSAKQKAPASFQYLAGKFDVRRDFRTVDFTRTISPGKALPTVLIPPSEFKDRKLTYILHLPMVPSETTATRVENNGRTLVWEKPLSGDIRQPLVVHFKAKIPVPPWLIASAAGVALLLLSVPALLFVRKRQRAGTSLK
jgi:hypothetical protein